MGTFESKVSEIFHENPKLARSIPVVIRKIFQESEFKFKQRLRNDLLFARDISLEILGLFP